MDIRLGSGLARLWWGGWFILFYGLEKFVTKGVVLEANKGIASDALHKSRVLRGLSQGVRGGGFFWLRPTFELGTGKGILL